MLGGGHHAVAEVGALQALDEGVAHRRHELRILAVRLLAPPPARVTTHVEHRRQTLVGTHRAHLEPDGIGDGTVVLGPERAGDTERLREDRGLPRHEARADLLVHDGGDAEAGVLDEVLLDLVGERSRGGGAQAARPADPRDVADPVAQDRLGALRVEAVRPAIWKTQALPSWASFSSSVMSASRSATRSSTDAEASRYVGVGSVAVIEFPGGWKRAGVRSCGRPCADHSLTAPAVSPPMIWRSAIA